MCWNCGCMRPDDDMGSPDTITTATLVKAGKATGNKNLKDIVETMMLTYNAKVKGSPADTKPLSQM